MRPTEYSLQPMHGSYLTPRFEDARVYDAMRKGIFTCPPETPLRDVARMMATYHIHSVVVTDIEDDDDGRPWGVVSALDLARVAGESDNRTAGQIAGSEIITISSDDTMTHAAQLMAEHDTSHLVVVHANTGKPVGVVSTLDLAGVLAWGEA